MFFKNFGNYSFEQISDIVMGLNPAAFMENLFLYYNSYIMMKINGYQIVKKEIYVKHMSLVTWLCHELPSRI